MSSYSFSGADVSNAAWFDYFTSDGKSAVTPSVNLTTLSTISFTIHEAKSPVRSLGNKNVSGFTSSIRTIAGSMILSIVDRHPFAELIDEYLKVKGPDPYWGWSRDHRQDGRGVVASRIMSKMMPTSLAPFNMLFTAVPEVFDAGTETTGVKTFNYASCALFGIELVEDSTVLSVNNILTEMSFTFVARDYAVLDQSSGYMADENMSPDAIRSRVAAMMAPTAEGVTPASAHALTAMKGGMTCSRYNENPYADPSEDDGSVIFSSQDTIGGRKLRWR